MHQAVVGISVRKIYECIVFSSGDNGRVVNDAVDEYQWAIVLIADRARLRDAGWEGLLPRASHDLAVRTEVHEAGVEEKRPVGAWRCERHRLRYEVSWRSSRQGAPLLLDRLRQG